MVTLNVQWYQKQELQVLSFLIATEHFLLLRTLLHA